MAATKEWITILVSKDFFVKYKQACKDNKTTMSKPLQEKATDIIDAWEAKQTAPVQPT